MLSIKCERIHLPVVQISKKNQPPDSDGAILILDFGKKDSSSPLCIIIKQEQCRSVDQCVGNISPLSRVDP